jgi:hypothetical protein
LCGTSLLELLHQYLTTLFGNRRAGSYYTDCLLAILRHCYNWRASKRNRPKFPKVCHYNGRTLDKVNELYHCIFVSRNMELGFILMMQLCIAPQSSHRYPTSSSQNYCISWHSGKSREFNHACQRKRIVYNIPPTVSTCGTQHAFIFLSRHIIAVGRHMECETHQRCCKKHVHEASQKKGVSSIVVGQTSLCLKWQYTGPWSNMIPSKKVQKATWPS